MGDAGRIRLFLRPFAGGEEESHRLLRQAAARYAGRDGRWELARGPWGKPYFPAEPDLRFSLSHSGGVWACAFSRQELGLDLQRRQPCDRELLARRFFHPRERAFLERADEAAFFRLWAAKESYLKYTGRGITGGLDGFSVVGAAGDFPALDGVWLALLPWRPDYALCLCVREPGTVDVDEAL